MKKISTAWLIILAMAGSWAYAGTLSCSVTTAGACTGTIVLRMSNSSNAHAELPSQSTAAYANNVICCTGVTGLGTSCSGTTATVLKLASTTNSHSQQSSQSGYANSACLSVGAGGSVTVAYQSTNCTGYDTTLASMASTSNAHIGNTTAYTTKICGTASAGGSQSLSFAILSSTSTAFSGAINFGTLSTGQTRYASSTALGDSVETVAHTLAVNTNAASGYTISVTGATLTAGSYTITPLASNTSPSVGAEQFGIRASVSGSNGTVTAPYAASGFAFTSTATTAAQLASALTGDSATSTYSLRYMANIAPTTESASYSTSIVYVVTANF